MSTVPLVLSSVFVLAELNRISGGGSGEAGGAGFTSKSNGDDRKEPSGSVCADGAELAAYLEVMVESSILCAVWEVSWCVLGGGTGGRSEEGLAAACPPGVPPAVGTPLDTRGP